MVSNDMQTTPSNKHRIPESIIVTLTLGGLLVGGYGLWAGVSSIETTNAFQKYMDHEYAQACKERAYLCADYGYLWTSPIGSWTLKAIVEFLAASFVGILFGAIAVGTELLNKFTIIGASGFAVGRYLESYNKRHPRQSS